MANEIIYIPPSKNVGESVHDINDNFEYLDKKIPSGSVVFTEEEKTKLSGIAEGANKTVVDSEFSETSTNPVQNKVVLSALNSKPDKSVATSLQNQINSINTELDTKVDKVDGKGLSTNDYTTAEKTKLSGIAEGANKTVVDSEFSETSTNPVQNKVVLSALNSKPDKSVATSLQNQINSINTELDTKVDKVDGKGLSTNDYTTAEKTKLSGIAEGANNYIIKEYVTSINKDYRVLLSDNNETDIIADKLNKSSGLTFNPYTKELGVSGGVTAPIFSGNLSGNASSASKLATARTINGVSFDGSANIIIPRSIKRIHKASGTDGVSGYVKIISIKVTGTHANHPVEFVISQRNRGPYHLYVQFYSSNSTDPKLFEFKHFDPANKSVTAYIVKSDTSTWDIYIGKVESYDHIYVLDVLKADDDEGTRYTITYTNTLVSSVPTTNQTKSTATMQSHTHSDLASKTELADGLDTKVDKVDSTLLYSSSTTLSSPKTISITNLFTDYSLVLCNITTSSDKYSLILPLKYVKSLGTSSYYEAQGLLFYYATDSSMTIRTGLAQSNPTINSVKIISIL